jgi:hypothetical protein
MERADGAPLRLAYADPPFPGLAHYYRDQPTFGGEVDHVQLVSQLEEFDGWALSTSGKAETLAYVLGLCPPGVRLCPWVKPIGVSGKTRGAHHAWEALIVKPARLLQPGKRDWLRAMPARGGGSLIGRKPLAFCAWLFDLLGALPGDEFHDLFPGSGVVGSCWRQFDAGASLVDELDASLEVLGDASREYSSDAKALSLLQLDDV